MDIFKSSNDLVQKVHNTFIVNPSIRAGWLKIEGRDTRSGVLDKIDANTKIVMVSWISGAVRVGVNSVMAVANLVIAVVSPIFLQFDFSKNAFSRLGGNIKQIGHGTVLSIPVINVIYMRCVGLYPLGTSRPNQPVPEPSNVGEVEEHDQEKFLDSVEGEFTIEWLNDPEEPMKDDPLRELLKFAKSDLVVGLPDLPQFGRVYAVKPNSKSDELGEAPAIPQENIEEDELFKFLAGEGGDFVYLPGQFARDTQVSPWLWGDSETAEIGALEFYKKVLKIAPEGEAQKRVTLLACMACAQTFEVHQSFIEAIRSSKFEGSAEQSRYFLYANGTGRRFHFEVQENHLICQVSTLYDVKPINPKDDDILENVVAKYEIKRGFRINLETVEIKPTVGTVSRLPLEPSTTVE